MIDESTPFPSEKQIEVKPAGGQALRLMITPAGGQVDESTPFPSEKQIEVKPAGGHVVECRMRKDEPWNGE